MADIHIYSGDTATFECHITDSLGADFDITGATAKFTVRETENSAAVLSTTTTSGITLTDPTHGTLQVTIAAGATDSLAGTYVFDIEINMSGLVYAVAKGYLCIDEDVSY